MASDSHAQSKVTLERLNIAAFRELLEDQQIKAVQALPSHRSKDTFERFCKSLRMEGKTAEFMDWLSTNTEALNVSPADLPTIKKDLETGAWDTILFKPTWQAAEIRPLLQKKLHLTNTNEGTKPVVERTVGRPKTAVVDHTNEDLTKIQKLLDPILEKSYLEIPDTSDLNSILASVEKNTVDVLCLDIQGEWKGWLQMKSIPSFLSKKGKSGPITF
jgi:hypothetical protein